MKKSELKQLIKEEILKESTNFRFREQMEKVHSLETLGEKLGLIYMWVKQGVINKNEFILHIESLIK